MESRRLVRRIYSEKSIEKIDKKIRLLGSNGKINTFDFLNLRLTIEILLFGLLIFFHSKGYFLAPIVVILFHFLAEYFLLDAPIKKREKKLEEEAIFFFEVLLLTLQSGKNLVSALHVTAKNIDSELSLEFEKSLSEMKLGKSFSEALVGLKDRIPSETINNAILNIVQASVFGNNIEESLSNQLDFLRDKRLLDIKGAIGKLPTKISIISVVFFIPLILLVILAPVLVDFIMRT